MVSGVSDVASDKSSSSDNVTPFRRAKAKSGNFSRCGIPRDGQFLTVESDKPNSAASSAGPPKRAIKSDASLMESIISRSGTYCNPELRRAEKAVKPKESMTFSGSVVTIRDVAKEKKKYAEFGRRLKEAREALFDGDAKEFANSLDLVPHSYRNYERGDRLPDDTVVAKLARRGISLEWLFLAEKPMLDAIRANATANRSEIA